MGTERYRHCPSTPLTTRHYHGASSHRRSHKKYFWTWSTCPTAGVLPQGRRAPSDAGAAPNRARLRELPEEGGSMQRTGNLLLASTHPVASLLKHQQGIEAILGRDQRDDLSQVEPGSSRDRIRDLHDFILLPGAGWVESPNMRMKQAGSRGKGLLDRRIRRPARRRGIHRSKMTDVPLSALLPRTDPTPTHWPSEHIRDLGQQISRLTLDVVHPSIRNHHVRG